MILVNAPESLPPADGDVVATDIYESENYRRVRVVLASRIAACVYVKA